MEINQIASKANQYAVCSAAHGVISFEGKSMSLFKFYASLRADILGVITGVQNSDESLFWDQTTPNWVTNSDLEELYRKYLSRAKSYGFYVVTRHCECENPDHDDYPITDNYGLGITYQDERFIWPGNQMYQGPRVEKCPCAEGNPVENHWVIDDVIFDRDADQEKCNRLGRILSDLHEAMECAGDKRPRSAIREYLLRAVIRINDELLPEPMDSYIESRLSKTV